MKNILNSSIHIRVLKRKVLSSFLNFWRWLLSVWCYHRQTILKQMTGFVRSSVAKRFIFKVFRTANRSLKFIKWIDPFVTNILSYIINNGVATPLLSVEREVRWGGGGPISPFYLSLVLPSSRMKVIIRKGVHLGSSLLQMIWHVSFTTKKSDVIHFLIAHIRMINAQDWSLTQQKRSLLV